MSATASRQRPFRHKTALGPKLPIEPFRRWVNEQLETELIKARYEGHTEWQAVAKKRLAARLGVTTRAIYRYRFELKTVTEGTVDYAVSRDGRYHLYDIYPDRRDT